VHSYRVIAVLPADNDRARAGLARGFNDLQFGQQLQVGVAKVVWFNAPWGIISVAVPIRAKREEKAPRTVPRRVRRPRSGWLYARQAPATVIQYCASSVSMRCICAPGERRVPRWRLPLLMDAATIPPMCGRYASFLPAEAIARIFGSVNPRKSCRPTTAPWSAAGPRGPLPCLTDEHA
jgi:hypothetical protein